MNKELHKIKMVDIADKKESIRSAIGIAVLKISKQVYKAIKENKNPKGDPGIVAKISGIAGTKKTPYILTMCHPIELTSVDIDITYKKVKNHYKVIIKSYVKCKGKTGVEMEALTGAAIAALNFYDMCKPITKDTVIEKIFLYKKTGGKSGDFINKKIKI